MEVSTPHWGTSHPVTSQTVSANLSLYGPHALWLMVVVGGVNFVSSERQRLELLVLGENE